MHGPIHQPQSFPLVNKYRAEFVHQPILTFGKDLLVAVERADHCCQERICGEQRDAWVQAQFFKKLRRELMDALRLVLAYLSIDDELPRDGGVPLANELAAVFTDERV